MQRSAPPLARFLWAVALLPGCGPGPAGRVGGAGAPPRPTAPMTLDEARRYALALVNRDRAGEGLPEVELDEVASAAAQRHAEDLARHGVTAHQGTDGSVPEQRYAEAGGEDLATENAACFFDGVVRALDPDPRFRAAGIETIETAFFSEQPPEDGHRRNILGPHHRRLGVGLAQPVGIATPCLVHEFVVDEGEYEALPRAVRLGATVRVAGELGDGVEFGAVGVARIPPARPMSAAELLATGSYPIPPPAVLYTPPGYVGPKPVALEGRRFSIDLPLALDGGPGRYEISVWARRPGGPSLGMVGLRTLDVGGPGPGARSPVSPGGAPR